MLELTIGDYRFQQYFVSIVLMRPTTNNSDCPLGNSLCPAMIACYLLTTNYSERKPPKCLMSMDFSIVELAIDLNASVQSTIYIP